MKSLVLFTLLACSQASVIPLSPLAIGIVGPGEPGTIVQGPSAKATVSGPDGSTIIGSAIGGTVVAPPKAGGVVTSAISPGIVAPIAPIIVPKIVAPAPPLIAAPALLPAPANVLVAGPTGIVATGGHGLGVAKVINGGLW